MARTKKRLWWLVLVGATAALLWQRLRRPRPRRFEEMRPQAASASRGEGASAWQEVAGAPSVPPPAAESPTPESVPGDEGVEAAASSGEFDLAEAARILGCSSEEATALLDGGPATRESVEEVALRHYRWRRHVDDPDSYWVTLKQASTILGVPPERVKQMLESGDVPYVVHKDGVRLMRREQLAP